MTLRPKNIFYFYSKQLDKMYNYAKIIYIIQEKKDGFGVWYIINHF